jgi:hypothetical protein
MMRKFITSLLCTLACTSAVHADDREKTLYAAATPERPRWQDTSASMPSDEYTRSVDNNRELLEQELRAYSERVLASAGAYAPAIGLLGAAVAVAATDSRVHLNESKTMGMVFRDTASSDRSVLLEYRKSW